MILLILKSPVQVTDKNDSAVSALIGVILLVALVVIMTAVISVFFFGLIGDMHQKTAYVVAEAKYNTQYGYPLITLSNRAGDTGLLSGSGDGYPIAVQITTPGGSVTASPYPVGLKWAPGTYLFIIRTDAGYTVTDDPNKINGTPMAFLGNEITVNIIDTVSDVLIYSQKITMSSVNNTTSIYTSTATVTSTPTATATATATISTKKLMIIWSPASDGYASLSPPDPLENSRGINIPTGSSKTIYFMPDAGKAVVTIKLDGATVYSGSSVGATIEYTILNISEDHILRATFG
ncbi:type IV pilin N-terminal domain-containing protein [Methanomicrobium antiquum]|uniref:Type IV pilin N-terminal domain-containing protein n=1 Tax=Methanomicrobium antiquum TaxID=487686 RepID=A0AAF0FXM0_9EURY|nr:type IV pilin N-terminal domain-containing protein [Methanomicrobium antiquum]WFN37895.1 type IV pilin N-terminal domain-containing protein [Methanomicrobium antiquum]